MSLVPKISPAEVKVKQEVLLAALEKKKRMEKVRMMTHQSLFLKSTKTPLISKC
jgi:hypothetical protein